jgi:hypothetical protein
VKRLLVLLALVSLGAAPLDRPAGGSLFASVDILIDPKGHTLAAYQIEFAAEVGQVSLVGIEAGEPGPYAARPPYYDPAALAGNRVIVGDYSLAPDLPKTRTRVARLMLEIRGEAKPQYVVKLMAAADADGKAFAAEASVVQP